MKSLTTELALWQQSGFANLPSGSAFQSKDPLSAWLRCRSKIIVPGLDLTCNNTTKFNQYMLTKHLRKYNKVDFEKNLPVWVEIIAVYSNPIRTPGSEESIRLAPLPPHDTPQNHENGLQSGELSQGGSPVGDNLQNSYQPDLQQREMAQISSWDDKLTRNLLKIFLSGIIYLKVKYLISPIQGLTQ